MGNVVLSVKFEHFQGDEQLGKQKNKLLGEKHFSVK